MAASARILVVDDDRAVTRILRSMLELDGYQVEEAHGTATLAERLSESPPELMLLDLNMPGLSGLDVLAAMGQELAASCAIIVLSGETDDRKIAAHTMELGAVDFLVKPVPLDRLLQAVRSALERRGLEQEIGRAHDRARRAVELAESNSRFADELTHAARAKEEQIAILLEALGSALLIRPDGRIELATPAANRLLERGDVSGSRLSDVASSVAESTELPSLEYWRASSGRELEVELRAGEAGAWSVVVLAARSGTRSQPESTHV